MVTDQSVPMRSLWRIKLEASVWITLFAAVFFVGFFTLRVHFTNGFPDTLNGVMQPSEWGMAITCALTVLCTFIFSKVYYAFNRDIYRSNTEELRLIHRDTKQIPEVKKQLKEIWDYLVTEAVDNDEEEP